jgi:hypothetical protein
MNPVVLENKDRHTDAARRCSDIVNLHIAAAGDQAYGKVIAISLADGSSDDTLYPDKYEAARHQHHNERFYAFIRIPRGGMPICDAESFLWVHRMARERDIGSPDLSRADGGLELITPLTREGLARQLRELRRLTGQ